MQTPRVSQRGPASSGVARQEEEDGADRRAPLGSGRARAGDGLACAGVAGLWRLVGPEGRRGKKKSFSFSLEETNTFNLNLNSRIQIQTEQQTIKQYKSNMKATPE